MKVIKLLVLGVVMCFALSSFSQNSNYALNFDGSDDYIQLVSPVGISSSSNTVELWLKVPTVGNGGLTSSERVGIVLGGYDSSPHFNYEITTGGRPRVWWNAGEVNLTAPSSVDVRDGKWHHLAFVRDNTLGQFLIYVDGVVVANSTSAGSDITVTTAQRIGRDNRTSSPTHNLHGTVDEMRIWNIAKSAQQIREAMCSTVPLTASGLVSYVDFNSSSGTAVADQVGTLSGTLTNFALSGSASNWVVSDAPIGDTSVFEYNAGAASVISMPSQVNGVFNVSNVAGSLGSADGVHIYRVDSAPNYSDTLIDNISGNDVYYGVFEAGLGANLTFDVEYDYTNMAAVQTAAEPYTVLMERDYYSDSTWLNSAASLNVVSNTIQDVGVSSRMEYMLGQGQSPVMPPVSMYNNSLDFDGDDDYIQLNQPAGIGSTSNTVELWLKVPVVGTGGLTSSERVGIVLGGYNSTPHFNYEITSGGSPRVYWNAGEVNLTAPSSVDLRDGKWHHLAYVRDNTLNQFLIYVDGVQVASSTSAGSDIVVTTAQRIGRDNRTSSPTHNLHGTMDEFRIWGVAKTETEIRQSMCSTIPLTSAGLLSYFDFNVASGSSITDQVGSLFGTLNNFNLSGSNSNWLISGAPVGDVSIYEYAPSAATTLTMNSLTNGDFEVSNISGSAGPDDGIHVYRLDTVPNFSDTLIDNIPNNNAYFGVFEAGLGANLTFDVKYDYNNVAAVQGPAEHLTVLLERDNYADSSWIDANGNLSTPQNTIVKTAVVETSEFALGQGLLPPPPPPTFNNAFSFDGENDFIQLADTIGVGSSSHTFELWVKVPLVGTDNLDSGERVGNLLGSYDASPNFNYEIHSLGNPRIWWNNGEINFIASSQDLRDNKWHHLAFVRDVVADSFLIYIDGEVVHEINGVGTDINVQVPHRIGGDNRNSDGGPSFHGQMDEIRLWSKAKTQAEIREDMCKKPSTQTDLLSYFPFDGENVTDQGAAGNNGTLTNVDPLGSLSGYRISGAPVGDASAYLHTSNFSNQTISIGNLNSTFSIDSISGFIDGVHVYRVDTVPHSDSGIYEIGNQEFYYGVFVSQVGASNGLNYHVIYDYSSDALAMSNETNINLYSRRAGDVTPWVSGAATKDLVANDIEVVTTAGRGEYILADYNGSPCSGPDNIQLDNITLTTVDVSWSSTSPSSKLEYGLQGFAIGTGQEVTATGGSYTINGLATETTYELYVGDTCAATGGYVWVGPLVFTTLAPCPLPNVFELVSTTDSSATFNVASDGINTKWITSHGPVGFNVDFGLQITHTNVPLVINNLSELTSYDIYVRADCDSLVGDWFGPLTFTTDSAGSVGVETIGGLDSHFSVYPNPAKSELTIEINNANQSVKSIELYSLTGSVVLTERINDGDTKITIAIPESVSSGLYLLRINAGEGIVNKRIVIQD